MTDVGFPGKSFNLKAEGKGNFSKFQSPYIKIPNWPLWNRILQEPRKLVKHSMCTTQCSRKNINVWKRTLIVTSKDL